jgi:hypothetical protein
MMVATLLEYIKEEIFYSKQYLYLVNCFVGELVYRPPSFFLPPPPINSFSLCACQNFFD